LPTSTCALATSPGSASGAAVPPVDGPGSSARAAAGAASAQATSSMAMRRAGIPLAFSDAYEVS
jgi:hypothetical protein